ncbi:MAG: ABC transporter permease [Gemmatimonadota bacterium]
MSATWAVRQLRRRLGRTLLAVVGIAVAAALLLDMVMLGGGMERSFQDLLLSRGFQIRLSPKGTLPFDTEATLPRASAIADRLRANPAIEAAGAILVAPLHVRVGDSLVALVGFGVDPRGQGLYRLVEGGDLTAGDERGIVIGAPTAERTGWRIGDTVTIRGRLDPGAATAAAERRVVVRGIVDWLYDSKGRRSLGAVLPVIQALSVTPDGDRASLLMVKVRDDREVEAVADRIRAELPNVEVNSIAALVRQFRIRMTYFHQLSVILATISLIVAVLLVGTLLTITVNERLGEIATLRAIGVARATIVKQVLFEGGILTGLGTVAGLLLGIWTARYLDRILTSFPGLPAAISFFVPDAPSLARAGILLLVTGTLAGGYPAWLAARAPIATTLRSEAE